MTTGSTADEQLSHHRRGGSSPGGRDRRVGGDALAHRDGGGRPRAVTWSSTSRRACTATGSACSTSRRSTSSASGASARSWASRIEPGVETALALSGSAAQSKIQTYPGDCDYFERVNIHAPTREDACRILGEVMRDKALGTERGDGYRLIEVTFGSAPFEIIVDGEPRHSGSALRWQPAEVAGGSLVGVRPDGSPAEIRWEEAAADPGWCKLDWVVADPVRGTLANASNMLDVTWEAPDGTITPLDGHLDGYFQEVYLEADSIPIFAKLVRNASADALDEYVAMLEHEVDEVPDQGPQLRQGREADVQRLPPDRPLPGGGIHPRAVRRAGGGAVPGVVAAPHARRRDVDLASRRRSETPRPMPTC